MEDEEWGKMKGLIYNINLERSYAVLGVERNAERRLLRRSARLLAVARGHCKEHNWEMATIGCNDGFDFFVLKYRCSTGHLDTDFLFWNER